MIEELENLPNTLGGTDDDGRVRILPFAMFTGENDARDEANDHFRHPHNQRGEADHVEEYVALNDEIQRANRHPGNEATLE